MPWEAWVLVVWLFLEGCREIIFIDRFRDPITPLHALGNILFYSFFAILVLSLAEVI